MNVFTRPETNRSAGPTFPVRKSTNVRNTSISPPSTRCVESLTKASSIWFFSLAHFAAVVSFILSYSCCMAIFSSYACFATPNCRRNSSTFWLRPPKTIPARAPCWFNSFMISFMPPMPSIFSILSASILASFMCCRIISITSMP